MKASDANAVLNLIRAAEEILACPEMQANRPLYSETVLRITRLHNAMHRVRSGDFYKILLAKTLD